MAFLLLTFWQPTTSHYMLDCEHALLPSARSLADSYGN
jgi:hypothetical protein